MANVSKSTDILKNRVMNDIWGYDNNTVALEAGTLVVGGRNITKVFVETTKVDNTDITLRGANGDSVVNTTAYKIEVMFELDGTEVVVGTEHTNKCLDWKKIHEVIK